MLPCAPTILIGLYCYAMRKLITLRSEASPACLLALPVGMSSRWRLLAPWLSLRKAQMTLCSRSARLTTVGQPIASSRHLDPFETLVSVGRMIRGASRQSQLPEGISEEGDNPSRPASLGSWPSRVTNHHRRSADSSINACAPPSGGPEGKATDC